MVSNARRKSRDENLEYQWQMDEWDNFVEGYVLQDVVDDQIIVQLWKFSSRSTQPRGWAPGPVFPLRHKHYSLNASHSLIFH